MSYNRLILSVYIFYSVYALEENPRIIIIGSGPSGIAAATKLWKANFTNIKVLEAEPRIGGRINSVKFGDAYVDMGAEWCHGEKGNIVYNMMKQYNILKHTNTSYKLIYSNGSYLDEDIYDNLEEYYVESLDGNGSDLQVKESCKDLTSMGACFDKTFNTTCGKNYRNDHEKLRICLEATDWLQSYILSYDSPFTLYDLARGTDFKISEGDPAVSWNGHGYKTILELMMQKFPDLTKQLPIEANILLNKEVTRIIWTGNVTGKVSVQCSDKSRFEADHLIFTPSLGVLKANYRTMFDPALPDDKINAIKTAGFGAILKIILHFPQTWWKPVSEAENFGFVWSTEDKDRILSEFGHGPVKNGRSWLTTSAGVVPGENNPKVLIIFFSGDMVPEIEKTDNQVLKDGCFYMLKKFLGKNTTPIEPDDILKTTWHSNPHFRGTYSYDSVEGGSAEHKFPEKLGSPLKTDTGKPVVQFAGEATHPYYFSTVHGAIETGYREAERIIDWYARNREETGTSSDNI